MSHWKLAAAAVYALGGTATTRDVELAGVDPHGLYAARRLGLVEHSEWRWIDCQWWLTPLGIDWCEGRVALAPAPFTGRTGRPPMRFVATWLSSLPRGIRINAEA